MSIFSGPELTTDNLVLCIDAENPKSYSPNVHPNPVDIYTWVNNATGNNCTLSRDTITSPVGTSPLKMVQTGNDPYANTYTSGSGTWKLSAATLGQTWTVSVWVKASTAIAIEGCWVAEQDTSGNYLAGGGSPNPTISTEWTRISGTYTLVNASVAFVGLRLDGTQTGGSGVTIWWDGLQLEKASSATAFRPYIGTTTWKDLSAGNNNGTLVNSPTYGSDYLTFAYASSQQITFASNVNLQFLNNSAYTLEAWVYPTRNPGANNWTGIFDRESNPGSGRDGYNIYFLGSAGTTTYFITERFCAGVNTQCSLSLDQSVSVNAWHHIVATYDGTTLSLYRNGVFSSSVASTGIISNTSKTLTIANRGGNYFDGRVALSNIYSKALTAAEVKQNFNALRGRFGI